MEFTKGRQEMLIVTSYSSDEDEESLFPGGIVTNCTFGGQDLTTLYVTAGGCLYQAETQRQGLNLSAM